MNLKQTRKVGWGMVTLLAVLSIVYAIVTSNSEILTLSSMITTILAGFTISAIIAVVTPQKEKLWMYVPMALIVLILFQLITPLVAYLVAAIGL